VAVVRAVVAGMIGTFPIGGVAWDYGQYILGLERLGFDVFYLEDNGCWSYDGDSGTYSENGAYGAAFIQSALVDIGSRFGPRWHFRAADGTTYGVSHDAAVHAVAGADVLVNVSGATLLRPEYRDCRRTILIDTDPGWNHFVVFPRADARSDDDQATGYRAHDSFFTYASRIGDPACNLPDLGLDWRRTRPPVVLDAWQPRPPGATWTTVLSWDNYEEPVVVGDLRFGSKADELAPLLDLPRRTSATLELALGGARPPIDELRGHGWLVVDGPDVTRTAARYRDYIASSRGELSVAKNVYVATGSGWFSCRSACYLAAGRPVVVQDTGFSASLPTGVGLLAFRTPKEAVAALETVEADYETHAAAAREFAARHLDATVVLAQMLEEAGV
jgi:hypothetical protein